MQKKIRIGIFGVGYRGNGLGRGGSLIGCVEKSGAEVVAICDNKELHLRYCKEQCFKNKSLGILQTTWHRPELALPTVVYSGAYMWCGEEPTEETVNKVLN